MKLSQKRRQAVYDAISEQVIQCRIALNRRGLLAEDDHRIAQAVEPINRDVLTALGVERQHDD